MHRHKYLETGGPQHMVTTFEKVRAVVAESLGLELKAVRPTSSFRGDLGADSMDLAELILDLEETFGIEVPDDDLSTFLTVQDAVDRVEK